jgi:hypothetical protein
MNKYRVMIHGENVLADVEGVRHLLGFYTHVFIEAFSRADAESRALELLRGDAKLRDMTLNPLDDPIRLSVEEAEELESFEGFTLPRTGLALYPVEGHS